MPKGAQLRTEHLLESGDWAVVELHSLATAKNGLRFDNRYCWVCRFVNGTIVEVRAYLDSVMVARLFEENPIAVIKTSAAALLRGGHQGRRWPREGGCQVAIDHSKGNGQNKSRRSPHTFVFAITMLVAFPSSSPAQVRVLISGGFSAPYQELLPQFEKSTGITARPCLHLFAHGLEIPLHAVDANRDAVDERGRLRVLCQHRRELAQDNVSTFCVRLSESDVCTGSI